MFQIKVNIPLDANFDSLKDAVLRVATIFHCDTCITKVGTQATILCVRPIPLEELLAVRGYSSATFIACKECGRTMLRTASVTGMCMYCQDSVTFVTDDEE